MNRQANLYEAITQQIVSAIESGHANGAWKMPWHSLGAPLCAPVNAISQRAYRGLNVLMLWAVAQSKGYESGQWGTFKQWKEAGACVKKGEKATTVIFWKVTEKADEEGEMDKQFYARASYVFNASQVSGFTAPALPILPEEARVEQAERFFAKLGAKVEVGGYEAFYSAGLDEIHIPRFEAFETATGYYATLGHEHIHWTGNKTRLDRDFSGRFGSEAYAFEELVAELGAAFLCAELGLALAPRADHARYIRGWLKCLKGDPHAIFTAARKAQAAVDWMKERQAS